MTFTKIKDMQAKKNDIFEKQNLIWMLIGVVVIILGALLMAGGKTTDPNVFDESSVYSTTRITIAPLMIMAGLLIEVYAIMKKNE
jgi:hypothetical protein